MLQYSSTNVSLWDRNQVRFWLKSKGMSVEIQNKFYDEAIDGETLLYLREKDIHLLLQNTSTPYGAKRKMEAYIDQIQSHHKPCSPTNISPFSSPIKSEQYVSNNKKMFIPELGSDTKESKMDINQNHYELENKCLPLHRFKCCDIANEIKWWIYNDIHHTKCLEKMIKIYIKHGLSGEVIGIQPLQNTKRIIENDLLKFITIDTLNIIFGETQYYLYDIDTKTPEEMAIIMYHYPLQKLIHAINTEKIDGKQFIKYYGTQNNFIRIQTGWKEEDVYQIQSILLKHRTLTITQLKQNIRRIFNANDNNAGKWLSDKVMKQIEDTIFKFDVEKLHYQIKHSKPIDDFSDAVINMVDDLLANQGNAALSESNFIRRIYENIANCFRMKHDVQYYEEEQEELSYFIEVTEVTEEKFVIRLNTVNVDNAPSTRYDIKDVPLMNLVNQPELGTVSISGKRTFGTCDVYFDENHDNDYQIAAYHAYDTEPLSNNLKLRKFERMSHYKPQPIDISTVKKIFDLDKERVYLYWHTPSSTYGKITYKVIYPTTSGNNDENKYDDIDPEIQLLPYEIPLSIVPIQINIITVSEINGKRILSEPSETINIGITQKLAEVVDQRWICSNCGHYNVENYVNSAINHDLSICILCGIQQTDSIIIQLKNSVTFTSSTNHRYHAVDEKEETIDKLIEMAMKQDYFNLTCLDRNDNAICPSILELTSVLMQYNRWIKKVFVKTKGKDRIDKTIHVEWQKYINDEEFNQIFIECALSIDKISRDSNNIQILSLILDNKHIMSRDIFFRSNRKQFINDIKNQSNILTASGCKLYNKILIELKNKAQKNQFGEYLCNLDIGKINEHYYHVLNSHIYHGNETTEENALRFFKKLGHYEDDDSQRKDCRSLKRCGQRIKEINSDNPENDDDYKQDEKEEILEDKHNDNMWQLKQKYTQQQLDNIHANLVHSEWKHLSPHNANQINHSDIMEEEIKQNAAELKENNEINDKYVTQLAEANIANYQFGINFSYPDFQPIYSSLREEILYNKIYPLRTILFQTELIKAIESRRLLLRTERDKWICTHYNDKYNIVRNEEIGIEHVLAVVIYTDVTYFCKAYRATFRKQNNEINDDVVRTRHQQFYHFSRSLYEAVEFYGQDMDTKEEVYHGLDTLLYFDRFTPYFNQPLSTTSSLTKAEEFSKCCGLVLTLTAGPQCPIPKYLDVWKVSDFAVEQEKLFYGKHVVFEIQNIRTFEERKIKTHRKQLLILNKLERTIQNKYVEWDRNNDDEESEIVDIIKHQQFINCNKHHMIEQKENTRYVHKLFDNLFSKCSADICINNFKLLPTKIQQALFNRENNDIFSLLPLTDLFINVKEVSLNGLNIPILIKESKSYFEAVLEYALASTQLETIVFRSIKLQYNGQKEYMLTQWAQFYKDALNKLNWDIEYKLNMKRHTLIFINHTAERMMEQQINIKEDMMARKYNKMQEEKESFQKELQIERIKMDRKLNEIDQEIKQLQQKKQDADDKNFALTLHYEDMDEINRTLLMEKEQEMIQRILLEQTKNEQIEQIKIQCQSEINRKLQAKEHEFEDRSIAMVEQKKEEFRVNEEFQRNRSYYNPDAPQQNIAFLGDYNMYLSAFKNDRLQLELREEGIGPNEIWISIPSTQRRICIKLKKANLYLSCNRNGELSLVSQIKESEKWLVEKDINGKFSFQSHYKTYLCSTNDGQPIVIPNNNEPSTKWNITVVGYYLT